MMFAHALRLCRRSRHCGLLPSAASALFILLLAFSAAAPCSGASFHSFAFNHYLFGISADGRVVVGRGGITTAQGRYDGFRWTELEGFVGVGSPTKYFIPDAISADGSVMVGIANKFGTDFAAFWLNVDGTLVDLNPNHPRASSIPRDVSHNGKVIVGGGNGSAIRWTVTEEGTVQREVLSGFEHSQAWSVSGDGSTTVGNVRAGGNSKAMRWTAAGMELLHEENLGANSYANDVSVDGSIIVGGSSAGPFRWTEASGPVLLPLLPGATGGQAYAISADGSLIGGYNTTPSGERTATLWDAQGRVRTVLEVLTQDYGLDLEGWHLTRVGGINSGGISADGRVLIGEGKNPDGKTRYWRAVLAVPEPAARHLIVLGTILVGWRRGARCKHHG